MKSIERRFNNISEKSSNLSTYSCFARAIAGQAFNRGTIHRWFYRLVDNDDYADRDKRAILANLQVLTNTARTTEKGTKFGT